ncbi:hypothetical protein [Nitratidesulfovibrio sp. SRB-5]|uniref:hypothetical protein n=1 Tax=Nitratidesulfovibrio sp. SRB-5 TaxID=2872636 RepID=UPI0010285F2D|nr:hypothetical protein [Nitratidesulfovibrio sp. SRB-5]MBZ2172175.1 hypothetical protein [Nitratidesulfovibrio sp. SRB-5]RXF77370.1 hypothetical protein EKK70_06895 [Desulfovibrio sp. DS-1]
MKVVGSRALLLVVMLWFAVPAMAGPFGTNMGDRLEKFPGAVASGDTPFWYSMTNVPKPHSLFESYLAGVHPEIGLAVIVGLSHTFRNDRFGSSVRTSFDSLKKQLDSIYGEGKLLDVLRYGSIWKEPNEWVASISHNERTYACYWTKSGKARLKDNIDGIMLSVKAQSGDSAYIVLRYEYENMNRFQTLYEQSEKDSL